MHITEGTALHCRIQWQSSELQRPPWIIDFRVHAFFFKITFVVNRYTMYLGLGCNTTITTVFSIPSTKIKSGKESKKGRKITIKPTGKDRKKLKTPLKTQYYLTYIYLRFCLAEVWVWFTSSQIIQCLVISLFFFKVGFQNLDFSSF